MPTVVINLLLVKYYKLEAIRYSITPFIADTRISNKMFQKVPQILGINQLGSSG